MRSPWSTRRSGFFWSLLSIDESGFVRWGIRDADIIKAPLSVWGFDPGLSLARFARKGKSPSSDPGRHNRTHDRQFHQAVISRSTVFPISVAGALISMSGLR